ncbi:MAG: hypothetical protein E7311_07080 [Clostridiales bacterium]|nr:hypothetical protein [Clostridiales bacterium]
MKKVKELFEKYRKGEIADKKKIENIVYILIMLVILVIGINQIWFTEDKEKIEDNKQVITNSNLNEEETTQDLEVRLKNILEKVSGVSNVSVLINYIETKQIQPIYDTQEKETTTNETDNEGGNRNIIEKDYSKTVVYEEKNNEKNIIIQKEEKPKIAGVIVVANFNNNNELKEQIVKAVASVTNISEYKVQVLNGG